MSHPEKYARPGIYLDTDDHERLLEENRGAYLMEEAEMLRQELETLSAALRVVQDDETKGRLSGEMSRIRAELDDVENRLRHERPPY